MEVVIRARLKTINESVEQYLDAGQSTLQIIDTIDLSEAQIICAKLKSAVDRLVSEIYQYFKFIKKPSADEMEHYTANQIKAEELITDLNFKIEQRSKNPTTVLARYDTSKLPRMELPKFNGDVLKWHQFWDQFASNVDSRNIGDVDKLLYLQSVLEGEAKRAIEGLDTTNKNYQIAVSTLKDRYGKQSTIIDAHYAALFKIKPANKTITDSRRTYNDFERHLRVLESLGEDINHNHLRVMIMQKFNKEIVYELRMKMSTTEMDTIENIRHHLGNIISAHESSNRVKEESVDTNDGDRFTLETLHTRTESRGPRPKSFQNKDHREKFQRRGHLPQATRFSVNDRESKPHQTRKRHFIKGNDKPREPERKRTRLSCIFCGGGHFNDECNVVKTIAERKKRLAGRCYNCLAKGHAVKECRSHRQCRHCEKTGQHNRALCPTIETSQMHMKTTGLHVSNSGDGKKHTVLQTAVVQIHGSGDRPTTRACRILLDCGSQRTYITKKLAASLELPELESNNLSVFTFGTPHPHEIQSPVVGFDITTRTGCSRTVYANVVPHITKGIKTVPHHILESFHANEAFNDRVLADDTSMGDEIDVLLGNDYYFSFVNGAKVEIAKDLYLVDTILGWVWSGNCVAPSQNDKDKLSVLTYFQSSVEFTGFSEPDLPLKSDNLKRLWDLESIGITDSPKASRDDNAIKQFNETIQYFDNRYHVKWPWMDHPPILPSNYGLAYGRLVSLLKRLDDDAVRAYDNIIKEQLEKGIIEIVEDTETLPEHPIHYLPHHCIVQGNKLRLVYDASAKTKGNKSLNECLYRGPLMLEDLTGLLIRFREHRIGIVADVEKAFLQIGLSHEDRDVTRFLWPKDLKETTTPDNLLHLRFCRVPFGVISSPFLLNATIRYHLRQKENRIYKQIADDLYVDNLVTGADSLKTATELYQKSKDAFDELSMNLREWNSNKAKLMDSIPPRYHSKEKTSMKVLGLSWDLNQDKIGLRFTLEGKELQKIDTKREVLRLIASVFDPCGFAVPLMLPSKLFLQNLWYNKMDWDTKFCAEALKEWGTVSESLQHIENIAIPRSFIEGMTEQAGEEVVHELHACTDSSMQAYAGVIYLRSTSRTKTNLSFVIGKSRLVGREQQTDLQIPKLELLGAVIGVRLLQKALEFLRIQVAQSFLWTDSQIVISWCNTKKLLPPFIAKRVEEIKRLKNLHIRYVPTHLNPADVATRPNPSATSTDRWLKGPDFLYNNTNTWPTNRCLPAESPLNSILVEEFSGGQGLSETQIEETNNYHSRTSQASQKKEPRTNTFETVSEKSMDNLIEIRQVQTDCFPDERKGKRNLGSLGIYVDEHGILRCGGRLDNADWSEEQKHPILLPKNHEFTTKIIEKTHRDNYHVGVSHTLSLIRKKYWIPKGRAQVQKVLKQCQSCRKFAGGPFKLPPMAKLPTERVTYSEPFTYVGIDYFGPLLVDDNGSSVKRWVCLYTCLAVRAIHMEVVADLTAEECLLALRRFVSSRGIPKLITSDNALQFKLSADVLTGDYCITNSIEWKFIPELAPWFGGYYERLIGIVKNCLKKTLGKHMLNHTQLCTVIKEIEAVVNSRPLTVVGGELEHVLTPADFLRTGGPSLPQTSDREFLEATTVTKFNLIDGWKRGQRILQEYIQMFCNQYLNSLRDRNTMHRQPRIVVDRTPKIGDVVQVKGGTNRALWKVGKIIAVVKGTDDKIRVAKIATSPNEILTRSIGHLYPLEIEEDKPEITEHLAQSPAHNPPANDDAQATFDSVGSSAQLDPLSEDVHAAPGSIQRGNLADNTETASDPEQLPAQLDASPDGNQAYSDKISTTSQMDETRLRPKRSSAQKAREKVKLWTQLLFP